MLLKRSYTLFFLTSLCLVLSSAIQAWTQETILYQFSGRKGDGAAPLAGVIFDSAGNLYGTTPIGGVHGQGMVFELSPSNEGWTGTLLYSFTGGSDGGWPSAPLFMDNAGNLYGTTQRGGPNGNPSGVVFKLHRTGSKWHEEVLHTFGYGSDGKTPSGLFVDEKGRVFGTTQYGGTYGDGTVWAMQYSPGAWQYEILYSFGENPNEGFGPLSGVVVDNNHHIYGSAQSPDQIAIVFELKYSPSGWLERIIYSFEGGENEPGPFGLVLDGSGNVYGSAPLGGANNSGTIFELSPSTDGWTETVIYNAVATGLTFDQSGNLYGVNNLFQGSSENSLFELSPSSNGWIESFFFQFENATGYSPNGGLVFDSAGNIYGTTNGGGPKGYNLGVVYEMTP